MSLTRTIIAFVFIVPFACLADEPRKPIPDDATQKKIETTLKDLFKADYAKTKPPDRKSLAGKLLKLAGEEKDPAGRFVLLREVRDINAQLGDFEGAQRVLRTLAADYEINEVDEMMEIIRSAFKISNLARGDLKILAAGEVAKPSDSKPVLELADAWSVCAEQEKGRAKSLLLGRAALWYAIAANDTSISVLTKKEIENKKTRTITAIEDWDDKAGRWTLWEGKWQAKYSNGHVRTYVIGPDGLVNYPEDKATGRLVRSHDGIHLRLSNGQMELLRHLGNEIGIDHFSYARDYPKKVSHKATATRIP